MMNCLPAVNIANMWICSYSYRSPIHLFIYIGLDGNFHNVYISSIGLTIVTACIAINSLVQSPCMLF